MDNPGRRLGAGASDRAGARHPRRPGGFWISRKGRVSASGIAQLLRRRGRRLASTNLHAHLFRHTSHTGDCEGAATPSRCAWPAGDPTRCSSATPPRSLTSASARSTDGSRQETACRAPQGDCLGYAAKCPIEKKLWRTAIEGDVARRFAPASTSERHVTEAPRGRQ